MDTKTQQIQDVREVSSIISILPPVPGGPPANSVTEAFEREVQTLITKSNAESAVSADKDK